MSTDRATRQRGPTRQDQHQPGGVASHDEVPAGPMEPENLRQKISKSNSCDDGGRVASGGDSEDGGDSSRDGGDSGVLDDLVTAASSQDPLDSLGKETRGGNL